MAASATVEPSISSPILGTASPVSPHDVEGFQEPPYSSFWAFVWPGLAGAGQTARMFSAVAMGIRRAYECQFGYHAISRPNGDTRPDLPPSHARP